MLTLAVAALCMFVASCTFDGDAYVRFTWEASENRFITHISASLEDMDWWYDEVYADLANQDADFSDVPLYGGNPRVGSLFNFGTSNHPNKGRYWRTSPGWFTAVCGVEDNFGLAEIVANYRITVNPGTSDGDGADKFFEIAFDVGAFLDGEDELGWFWDDFDNRNTVEMLRKPRLTKVGAKQIVQADGTMDVEYFVIRRPKR
jgi:hypothetical protein